MDKPDVFSIVILSCFEPGSFILDKIDNRTEFHSLTERLFNTLVLVVFLFPFWCRLFHTDERHTPQNCRMQMMLAAWRACACCILIPSKWNKTIYREKHGEDYLGFPRYIPINLFPTYYSLLHMKAVHISFCHPDLFSVMLFSILSQWYSGSLSHLVL